MNPERESLKRTIFTRCGLGLLQIVSESNTGRCASRTLGPEGGGLGVSHRSVGEENGSVGEENEAFFITVWKSLPRRGGQYMLAVSLSHYG